MYYFRDRLFQEVFKSQSDNEIYWTQINRIDVRHHLLKSANEVNVNIKDLVTLKKYHLCHSFSKLTYEMKIIGQHFIAERERLPSRCHINSSQNI